MAAWDVSVEEAIARMKVRHERGIDVVRVRLSDAFRDWPIGDLEECIRAAGGAGSLEGQPGLLFTATPRGSAIDFEVRS